MSRNAAFVTLVLLSTLACPTPARAGFDAVVVYPDRASVTRIVERDVGPHVDRLTIEDLPAGLERDSLRVRADGPEGLRIGALEFEQVRGSERVSDAARELERRLESLERQRDGIADRIAGRELQLKLLQRVTAPQGEYGAPPAEVLAEVDRLGELADSVYAQRRELIGRQRELEAGIERVKQSLADLGGEQRDTLTLSVAVEAPRPGTARLGIDYTVAEASWRPVYEWRLDTESARLVLVQSAELRQATGEDWEEARVAVSLSRPASGGKLPELTPWWIDIAAPPPELRLMRDSASADTERVQVTGSRVREAEQIEAELAGTVLSQRYALPGRTTVASTNRPYRFRLDEHTLEVALTARAVPQRRAAAWTFVETEWTGQAALPAGDVQLFQDGIAMGRLRFDGIAPGGALEASFGVDERLELDTELIRQSRDVTGLVNKRLRELREYRWKLTNRHARSIAVTLLAQMPVARDERIEVELTDRSDAPHRRDIDDTPGRLAWDLDLEPGATRELTVGFAVSWPQDLPGIEGW